MSEIPQRGPGAVNGQGSLQNAAAAVSESGSPEGAAPRPAAHASVSEAGASCAAPEEMLAAADGAASDGAAGLKVDLSPSDVNYNPPLIECLVTLFKLLGKVVSPSFLLSGLPIAEGVLRPSALIRAARLGGMKAKTVYRPTLDDISPLTLPCILLLKKQQGLRAGGHCRR